VIMASFLDVYVEVDDPVCKSFYDIQIANGYVYKSTAADFYIAALK